MLIKPRLRLVPDGTRIKFMRGRYMGLIVSALLSTASVILFFYPGLNLGIDFSGGVVMEVRTQGPADFGQIHAALNKASIPTRPTESPLSSSPTNGFGHETRLRSRWTS